MKIVSQAAKIFLKHKKRKPKTFISKAGSFVKKEAKDLYRFSKENPLLAAGSAVVGIGLGSGIGYLTSKTNKAGMNREIDKIQREKKSGVKNTNQQVMDRIARSQRY